MRLFCYLLCFIMGLAAIGCSKAPQETAKAGTNAAAPNPDTNPAINDAPNSNVGTEAVIPGVTGPLSANQVPQKSAGPNPVPAGATVAAASKPAPDDSTFSAELTDVGRETRTFRKHPQLLKVEKTIAPGNTSIKVFLRNGKVIDLPGEWINNLSTIPAADIIALLGAPADTQAMNPGETEKKKAQ